MTNRSSAVDISNISKKFGNTTVVNDVSLALEQGEFFSLMGPSGCGKSTLLRMIAGFEQPTQGEISISGKGVRDIPANRRPINMVFQDYAIFPHLDVSNNIAFGLRKSGLTKRALNQKVNDALEKVGLADYGKRHPTELSGGQRQRVALARALILEPEVLLLDEPLSALDKQLREKMQMELRHLQRSEGITFLMVTHDQSEALAISDRCGVMFDGKLAQVTSPSGLYDSPKSRKVADFIGKMNYLDAQVINTENETADISLNGFGFVSVSLNAWRPQTGESVAIGVRPERVHLDHQPINDADVNASALVMFVTFNGESVHYTLSLDGCNKTMDVSVPNFSYSKRFHEGERVHVALTAQSLVLLP